MSITIKFKDRPNLISEDPITVREVLAKTGCSEEKGIVAARVNHFQRPLSWQITFDSEIDFVMMNSIEGLEVYTRTLQLMLTSAADRVCGIKLRLRHSMSQSYFYDSADISISNEQFKKIDEEMHRMVKDSVPLTREVMSVDKARTTMAAQGYSDKEQLLRWANNDPVILYSCEGIYDFFGDALADTAACVPIFELHSYEGGMVLSPPVLSNVTKPVEFNPVAKTFALLQTYSKWMERFKIDTAAGLFKITTGGYSRDLIMACEAYHAKILDRIAEHIEQRSSVRLLCLAGPSSSGKTTASRRLREQLFTSGIESSTLELDNYFVDRSRTPRDGKGNYDFEALEALDTDLINEHLRDLLDGKEVTLPKFNFQTGERSAGPKMRLRPNDVLVIEGIHGLNDKISESISKDEKYRIFLCPLAGTNLDIHNRIGTTDTRLLRRMVRDYRTRGHSPEDTLRQWPSVVRGSFVHIFPYQTNADEIFNTSLAYELPVLKGYVLPMLKSVPEDSEEHGEAHRLLALLDYVPIIPDDNVPNLSILREFIGGSCFE